MTLTRRPFTVHDYARMRESGILTEDDRVELLDGGIYLMSPIGPLHVAIVNKLNKIFFQQVGAFGIVSVQNPIRLNDYSEPQPDIAILHHRDDFYTHALATPDDVLLVVAIADTTLEYDRDQKVPRYAQANISEVWLVDVSAQVIEQYTQPVQGMYRQWRKILFGDTIIATGIPGFTIKTDQLF